jgi:Ca2+-binding EF-hand superfamily protein
MSLFSTLSPDQQEQIHQAFLICDTDGNGCIDLQELKEVLKVLGEEGTEQQAKDLMKDIDTDGNGTISFDEFKEAMAGWWTVARD